MSRTGNIRPGLVALAAAALLLLALPAAALAEPQLNVEVTHSPTSIARNDERISYTLRVNNEAAVNPVVGDTLTCNGVPSEWGGDKIWLGKPVANLSFSYQWLRNGAPIAGAAGAFVKGGPLPTYAVTADDAGRAIQCLVTATVEGASKSQGTAFESEPPTVIEPLPSGGASLPRDFIQRRYRPTVIGVPDWGPSVSTASPGATLRCEPPASWNVTAFGDFAGPVTATGDLTLGSATVTNVEVGPSGGFVVGQGVSGPGIPAGATVTAVNKSSRQVTLSVVATATATGASITGAASATVTNVVTAQGQGRVTSGSTTVTEVTSTGGADFAVGQEVSGNGILTGTTITAVGAETLELSAPATASGTSALTAGAQPFAVGDQLSGWGIAPGTTITAVSGRTITLSAPPTASGGGIGLAKPGTWSFQWRRNGAVVATDETYEVTAADEESAVQCAAIATTGSGEAPDGAKALSSSTPINVGPLPAGIEQTPLIAGTGNPGSARIPGVEFNNTTSGQVKLELLLPPGGVGTRVAGIEFRGGGIGWGGTAKSACRSVEPTALMPARAICTTTTPVPPQRELDAVEVLASIGPGTPDPAQAIATVSGGGSAAASAADAFHFGPPIGFGVESFATKVADALGNDYTQAAGHPFSAAAEFDFAVRQTADGFPLSAQFTHDIVTDLPPGFIGNPGAIPQLCSGTRAVKEDLFESPSCPRSSIVGHASFVLDIGPSTNWPIYAIKPERGAPAQFEIYFKAQSALVTLTPRLRASEGYAIRLETPSLAKNPPILSVAATLCGYGTKLRAPVPGPHIGGPEAFGCKAPGEGGAEGANPKPFLTNPPSCPGAAPVTRLAIDSWENRGRVTADGSPDYSDPNWHVAEAIAPPVTGCDKVPFSPSVSFQPTSNRAEAPTGLDVAIKVPTDGLENPSGIAQSALKKAVVTLPKGMSVNPSAADGLGACMPDEISLGTNLPVRCPESSKVGTVEVETPLLEEPLGGAVYLAKQGRNPFGSLLALYLVIESAERGILVKLPGKVSPQADGQLITEFDENPQLPFSSLKLHFNSGNRAPLLNPSACGSYQIQTKLYPWSAPASAREITTDFQISAGPDGGPCPRGALEPQLDAGLTSPVAGTASPFVTRVWRAEGTQRFSSLELTMPPGLSAYLRGIPYCSDATLAGIPTAEGTGAGEVASPSCPAASQIGTISAGVGGGSNPYYVNTGRAYLAGPYKGAPLSIAVVTPAVAGPFDLGNVVVRAALQVDLQTARITAVSDPIPTILHGIPIDLRDLRINIDRPNFTLAPTNCEAMSISGSVGGEGGGNAAVSNRFQVGECGSLKFAPQLKLSLKGATKRSGHPALKAVVTYPAYAGQQRCAADRKRAQRLSRQAKQERRQARRTSARKAAALRKRANRHARQARQLSKDAKRCLTEPPPREANIARAQVGLPHSEFLDQGNLDKVCKQADLRAGTCPKRSIYGRAKAWTPLLDKPLEGPVYIGVGYGYKLPALVADLNGQVRILLVGRVDTTKQDGIRNTFEVVPDAPVSRFVLEMKGGKKYGLLENSENICRKTQRASAMFNAQNGASLHLRPKIANGCGKKAKHRRKAHRRGEGKKKG